MLFGSVKVLASVNNSHPVYRENCRPTGTLNVRLNSNSVRNLTHVFFPSMFPFVFPSAFLICHSNTHLLRIPLSVFRIITTTMDRIRSAFNGMVSVFIFHFVSRVNWLNLLQVVLCFEQLEVCNHFLPLQVCNHFFSCSCGNQEHIALIVSTLIGLPLD